MRLLLPALVICASGGGHLLVNWALRPVDRMSRTAAHMSLRKLAARLPVPPTGDALERLSLSLNQLLARLRDSLQASRRFLADASHELRTPLTIIKGELQEIASKQALPAEVGERLGSVLEEVARLEHLVAQVIVNLLDNAIRFTPRGGTVTLRCSQSSLYSMLEVRDTGIGIPAEALPNVFDRFFRVDEARSPEDGAPDLAPIAQGK
jgi:signal transduction histidine kinase